MCLDLPLNRCQLFGYALIAELLGVDLHVFKRDDVIPADVKVRRIH